MALQITKAGFAGKDLSYWNYNIKKNKNYKNINFVAISNWLKNKAEKSNVLKIYKIFNYIYLM